MTGEEAWRGLLPETLNLADFILISGEHRILGNEVEFNGEPTTIFMASGAEITDQLLNPTNGMELNIKFVDRSPAGKSHSP